MAVTTRCYHPIAIVEAMRISNQGCGTPFSQFATEYWKLSAAYNRKKRLPHELHVAAAARRQLWV